MEETKWWSKLFIVSATISVFLLITSPFGYKYGVFDLTASFGSLMLSLVVAVIVFLSSLVMVFVASKKGFVKDRNLTLMALGLALIPLIAMGPQIGKGRSVPPIHDITTDTQSPPEFVAIVALRKDGDNSLEYTYNGSAENLAKAQMAAYPDLDTIESPLSVADATARAAEVLVSLGLEVVNSDSNSGTVEATATSFWFGFKDDVVVRIRANGSGSTLDLRSVSRVGQSDVGVNASRIMKFVAAF